MNVAKFRTDIVIGFNVAPRLRPDTARVPAVSVAAEQFTVVSDSGQNLVRPL